MDATSVQSLIDKLRDLTATKILESGFTTPTIEITVTSTTANATRRFRSRKDPTPLRQTRIAEPTYELDTKAVEEFQRAAADVKEPPPPAKK